VNPLFWLPFSGFALAGALGLLVWHVRSWRAQQAAGLDPRALEYHRRQFRRRMQTSSMLGLVALSLPFGVWILPLWPKVGVFYWGAVLFVLLWLGALGLVDMWATKHYYGRLRDHYRIEKAKLEAELRRIQLGRGNGKPPKTFPGKGPGVKGPGTEPKP